ncbi:MAG TPA: tRNA pseudouridine(38-40) synthase TruA [Planctomycetota bacterium]|nr:tRNA pseudouridine(38-40) synthase TruA [Planctomycetota bacterium]
MPRRIKLIVEYDGTDFKGFQVQNADEPGGDVVRTDHPPMQAGDAPSRLRRRRTDASVRTVQGELEWALKAISGQPIRLAGASRTDAGVHARGQTVSFLLPDEVTIPIAELCAALNANLDDDVAAVHAEEVELNFHPQRDASGKIYTYSLFTRRERSALLRRTHWHVRFPLQTEPMRAAAKQLVGVHDFTSFATKLKDTQAKRAEDGKVALETVREIKRIDVDEDPSVPGRIVITVEGSGFLYQMVRTIAGSLVDVGRGYRSVEWLGEALAAKDRRKAGPTAPPHGLCLERVIY